MIQLAVLWVIVLQLRKLSSGRSSRKIRVEGINMLYVYLD